MKAWQIESAGGIDALALNTIPERHPGPGEVTVKVHANSINFRDLGMITNPAARGVAFPRIPNSDGAGEVVAVGDGVSDLDVGDRVAGCFFENWISGQCSPQIMAGALGGAVDGMLAEQVVLKRSGVVRIPEHLSFEEAACLPCAGLTAWRALVPVGHLKAGDTVLLLGTGGVSVFALQFAVMMGARVIITSSSDDKLARASQMGAWQTINYRNNPDWEKAVLDLTQGRGVDLTVETGGGGTLAKSVEATRVAGTIGLIGVLTGGQIDPTSIMRKSITLQGIYVGSAAQFVDMNAAISATEMHPLIDHRVDFNNAPDAYRAMQDANHFGKIVINR
ncbi:MAG: NAD(P)-dependent alcohol dehydrogenase [Burkholderiaceae bacterium]